MPANKPYKRTRNLFDPRSKTPFKLSRSRLENFFNCPRCFYLDRRLGIEPPGMPAFTLNSAVDELLKKEFDMYRAKHEAHPLMKEFGVDAVPLAHPMMDEWRENFKGVQYHHASTNLIIQGAIDDLWIDAQKKVYVVDYKSTSTTGVISLDTEYRQAYKRQMEIYQWLLRMNGFDVSDTGYFVYCNADKSKNAFNSVLEFGIEIISYTGNAGWVEEAIVQAHQCLMTDALPEPSKGCEYCEYRKIAFEEEHAKVLRPRAVNLQRELF